MRSFPILPIYEMWTNKASGVMNPLKPSGNYTSQLSYQSVTQYFEFVWISLHTAIISLNSVNQLIFVMVKCGVFFEVRTDFLNVI
jgi:hypothetical protein